MLAGWAVRIVECGPYKAEIDQLELKAVEDDFDCEVGGCLLLRVYDHVTSLRSCAFWWVSRQQALCGGLPSCLVGLACVEEFGRVRAVEKHQQQPVTRRGHTRCARCRRTSTFFCSFRASAEN
ncbi:hypothetical protein ETH_00031160 [Eimeria tenella]|uniref:Uncharacterized protein n=1 Tax=Eimeria tenella TaxID=5802 RepID=U6L3E5_EIMTE|nr:hypothetical protein ETH_00031160 [Eimeria tenella]CDJ43134.1 hypothetical protein ETH_00031160 [Eimeria tenella]|eukprot:XP_013233884.1 hypothetical protein ETH_00031160 [Eimeria tenella]